MGRNSISTMVIEYFDLCKKQFEEVEPQLDRLLAEGKISGGDRWYVHGMTHNYHYEEMGRMIDKAWKKVDKANRNYKGGVGQAYNDVASKSMWNIVMSSFREFCAEAREYVEKVDAGLAGIGITYTLNKEEEEK